MQKLTSQKLCQPLAIVMWALAPNWINSTKSHVHLSILAGLKTSRCSLRDSPHSVSQTVWFCCGGWTRALLPHMDSLHNCQLGSRPCFLAALRVPFSFPCLLIFRYHETKVTNIPDSTRCSHANICREVKQKYTRHTRSHQSLPSSDNRAICVYIILHYTYISNTQNEPILIRVKKKLTDT